MKKNEAVIYHHGYHRIANRLRLARYIAILFFLLFTLLLFLVFREDMTLNHFRYLLRNFDYTQNAASSSGKTIYYDGEANSSFGFVAGGLACLTDTRVFVTDRSSGTTFSSYHGYKAPRAVFSEKYMAVYDRSGSEVKVYNAFAELESFTYHGTVLSCALADDGTLAVAVAEEGSYYSVVYVYNSDLEEVNKLSKYKNVTSLAFSHDGEYLAVGSVYAGKGGTLDSELLLLKVGKKKATALVTFENESLWQVSFFENSSFVALTDKAILYFNEDGEHTKRVYYEESAPLGSMLAKDSVLTLTAGADSRREKAFLYDTEGELLAAISLTDRLTSYATLGDAYYFVVGNTLAVYDKNGTLLWEEALLEEDGRLVADSEDVFYATASSARKVTVSE